MQQEEERAQPGMEESAPAPEQGEPEPLKEKKKRAPRKKSAAVEKLEGELSALRDRFLSMQAEYDNFRRRSQTEKEGIYDVAVSDTVSALLPIADSISLALGQENASEGDMRKGVELIGAQIDTAFEKLGVKPMGEVGEPFDPRLHNAVAHIEDEDLGENVISAVYQKGYVLGERVIRPAMVQVAN